MNKTRCTFRDLLLIAVVLMCSAPTHAIEAESKPKWEVGLAGGELYSPHYPASNESRARSIVVPFGIYRGDFLKVGDGSFIKGVFLDEDNIEFDFSFNGAFNADSSDNEARTGMPDLDYLLEFGPSVTVKLREDNKSRFELGLPLRVVVSTDLSRFEHQGYVFNPQFRYQRPRVFGSKTRIVSSLGFTFTTDELQEYFYSVDPAYTTISRAQYDAKGGYLGANLVLALSYPVTRDLRFFWGSRLDWYKGAQNENSPLFTDNTTLSFSFGFTWRLAQSDDRVMSKAIR
jgi:outer membrane scaffolding protein for murein synthesis (MipA/OmpV family)